MPWLVKGDESRDEKLLFIHVPRCGGTSLTKHFHVEAKARKVTDVYHKIGQLYFFYRYRLLEKSNFVFVSWENLYALIVFTTAFIVYFADAGWGIEACRGSRWCPPPVSISFWVCGLATFCTSTFIMTASIMGRREPVRKFCMLVFGKFLFGFGGAPEYLHGVNYDGYLMHYTAEKLLRRKFIRPADLEDSFAIVRNPLSRMVSLYRYNLYPCESFVHFVRAWREKLQVYESTGNTEEWDVYCHVLPMHCFTHFRGQQLVPHVVKQEDLKVIKRRDGTETDLYRSKYRNLPPKVLRALVEMPHSNKRATTQPWYELYDQETLDMVVDMYAKDFVTFSYETSVPKRDDLVPRLTLAQLRGKLSPSAFVKTPSGQSSRRAGGPGSSAPGGERKPEESPESLVIVFDDADYGDDNCDTGSSVSSLSARSSSEEASQRHLSRDDTMRAHSVPQEQDSPDLENQRARGDGARHHSPEPENDNNVPADDGTDDDDDDDDDSSSGDHEAHQGQEQHALPDHHGGVISTV